MLRGVVRKSDLEVSLNKLSDLLLRSRADHPVHFFSALKNEKGRNAHDSELGRDRLILVNVYLEDSGSAIEFGGEGFDARSNCLARATPFRPKINQHGLVGLQDFRFEFSSGYC